MTALTLPLPLPRHVGRSAHPADIAQTLEWARIMLSGCCETLITVEPQVPEATPLIDSLDRQLERLRDLVEHADQPGLPIAL